MVRGVAWNVWKPCYCLASRCAPSANTIRNRVALPPAKPHEPYDNEVGKRWTEIAKATDNLKSLRSANFADQVELWRQGRTITMPLSAAAVTAQFPTALVLTPGSKP